MTNKLKEEIISEMIVNAQERIESARALSEIENYRDAISRSYYANVDILRGLLELENVFAKTHKGMIDKFHQFYIKTEKIDKKFGNFVSKAEKMREDADYSSKFVADRDMVENAINKTEMFLEAVIKLFRK